MMSNDHITRIHDLTSEYRAALRDIQSNVYLEPDERRAAAIEVFNEVADKQRGIIEAYEADRENATDKLHAELYKGDGVFASAVVQYATADPADLVKLAKLAGATDQPDLLRAAAVIARTNGDEATFLQVVQNDPVMHGMFRQHDDLSAEASSGVAHPMLQSVLAKPLDTPNGPTMADVMPTPDDLRRAEDERREAEQRQTREAATKYAGSIMRRVSGKVRRQVGADVSHVDPGA